MSGGSSTRQGVSGMAVAGTLVIGAAPGIIWLAAYYFAAEQIPLLSDLGAWNFAIGLALLVVGVAVGLAVTAGRAAPVATGPFNPRTNSLAIVALVLGFAFPLAAIPVGHVARAQIRRSNEQGAGLALAGLVLGYLSLFFLLLAVVAVAVALNQS